MDDFAESLWLVKDQLPVVSSEIGGHMIPQKYSSGPCKTAAIMELERYKNDALALGRIVKGSGSTKLYVKCTCALPSTPGVEIQSVFSDYAHYDKKSFNYASENDDVTMPEDILNTDYGIDIIKERREGRLQTRLIQSPGSHMEGTERIY